MATGAPAPIPFPMSSFPGANSQESSGRLINCYAEPLGEGKSAGVVIRRGAGLSQHATTGNTGYRCGLIVNNLSYETWSGNASTVDSSGNVTVIGSFPGTKKISIARNQASPTPDVVAVDLDNGAYVLGSANATYFTGVPTHYTAGSILPQPNSVCFQDGYFFFTIGSGQVYATALNSLTVNALTYVTIQAKADVSLLRGVPFSGFILFFTTGSCEVWQDAANPSPAFPYQRIGVLEFGLAQPNAIAGWETGFSQLIWVAQDNGVHWMQPGALSDTKISPPDLDRLIEAEVTAGNTLEASCYIAGGKKFWVLSSPDWTWEFNLQTQKWSERQSLNSSGLFGRWRATGGHPAFGKWLMGDEQSGNLVYPDITNYSENGAVQLFRIESAPVKDFPNQIRIARADFDFDLGVGIATSSQANAVAPVVAISLSKDGGQNWGNPLVRALGQQSNTKYGRVSVKNMGISSPAGDRWRLDVSDPVYVGFMGGTQSSDPRTVGA